MFYLIILLEAKELSTFSEAPPADVEGILADDTTASLADPASSLEGSLSVGSWVGWNEVDWQVPIGATPVDFPSKSYKFYNVVVK